MKALFRTWTILLLLAIVLVGVLVLRGQQGEEKKDPVVQAQEAIEKGLGMQLETQSSTGAGLKVLAVRKGSPADQEGIKVGDRIITVADRSVWHTYQFLDFMSQQREIMPALPVLVANKDNYRTVVFGRPSGSRTATPPPAGVSKSPKSAKPVEAGP